MSDKSHTKNKDFLESVIDFFSSVYLTLAMLGLITFFSLLGVMGHIRDVYHTKYFQLLLGILFINLLVCTLQRLPKAYRRVKLDGRPQAPPPPREADFVLKVDSGDPADVLKKAEDIAFGSGAGLKRREMVWPLKKGGQEKESTSLVSFHSRGRWSLLGPHVTHLGILLILLGGIIGSHYSINAGMFLKPGDKSSTAYIENNVGIELGFTVEVKDFKIKLYDNQQPSDYISHLAVIDDGEVVKEKKIEVNKPLYYGGYGIYQSSYEMDHRFRLFAAPLKSGDTLSKEVELREPWTLPGTSVSFMMVDYKQSSRGMGKNMGPRAIVIKFEGQEPMSQLNLFEKFPDFDKQRAGDYVLRFERMEAGYWTGLRLMKDPGTPVIWGGSILLILGVLQSFMVKHRRAWLVACKKGNTVELSLIGRTRKARSMLLSWEENIVGKLEKRLGATRTGPKK